jgi:DNA sulfur modification protein DndD
MSKVTFLGIGIQNLGPFRERQCLDLRVKSGQPVILVKALNGSGKTTLLTCLQVVLYGNKAVPGRTAEYEQLVRSLQRRDATGKARIDLELRIDLNGERDEITVSREWSVTPGKVTETLTVLRGGTEDTLLSEEWDEFIDSILPAELVQLFLFDGEKIEALANPRTLPDMLRRATESFLGIGGIEAVGKDLIAVERRALLQSKNSGSSFETARQQFDELEQELKRAEAQTSDMVQTRASALTYVEQVRKEYAHCVSHARRSGLATYEKAAEIRAAEQLARKRVEAAENAVREALADPLAPLATLGALWERYKLLWVQEADTKASKDLIGEIQRRDRRLLKALSASMPGPSMETVRQAFSDDLQRYQEAASKPVVLVAAPDPSLLESQIQTAQGRYEMAVKQLEDARTELTALERKVAAIPQGDQLADLLSQLQANAQALAAAEAQLASADQLLRDHTALIEQLRSRWTAARERMAHDYEGQALENKALAAGQRARSVLGVFKERLLASKAEWLSRMITSEFKALMRKQRLISTVQVDPQSYAVTIVDASRHELPMERLSAGERQLLAIAVLSALIRERKGRFPVVVDTPLARLDRTHRKALIQRFFAKVSHQVMVLSTDEEVEGSVYEEMKSHTAAAYQIHFSDENRCSSFRQLRATEELIVMP